MVDGVAAMPVRYGDDVIITYAPPTGEPVERIFNVFKGSDGEVLPFTKRFEDPEIAVQTQFTIAEAYFELAKRHRELGEEDLARERIEGGRKLLEEAIRDFPDTRFQAQADYLLANLDFEYAEEMQNLVADTDTENGLSDEERKARNEEAFQHYRAAINRFNDIVATYGDSAYAPKAQFKKAMSFERMGELDRSLDEYVKLSYRYPDSELIAETIARLGQYFLNQGSRIKAEAAAMKDADPVESEKSRLRALEMFKTAGEVFGRLAQRFPDHALAHKTTVLAGQCYIQAERYQSAVNAFDRVITDQAADPALRAEAMYWAGDSYMKLPDMIEAYRMFKNLTWDFPESKWAKFARGRLATETELQGLDE